MTCCCKEKKIVTTEKAPKAIGPYSVGVKLAQLVFTAGQAGIDPSTGKLVEGGIEAETRQTLTNIKNILEAANSGIDRVLKCTVFLKDMADFAKMNAVYGTFFTENPPARTTVQVAALPVGAIVEIDAVAAATEGCCCDCDCGDDCCCDCDETCGDDCDCDCHHK